jgi:hypothetical protein
VPGGGPVLPEGKAGTTARGVPGGDRRRGPAVAGSGRGRPCCRSTGRAGLPPGTAGIHPPLRPSRQVRPAVRARARHPGPDRLSGRTGGPREGPAAGRVPRRAHGGAHRAGTRHRRASARRQAARREHARLRAARYAGRGICHGLTDPLCRFSAYYRNPVLRAFFHALPGNRCWRGRTARLLQKCKNPRRRPPNPLLARRVPVAADAVSERKWHGAPVLGTVPQPRRPVAARQWLAPDCRISCSREEYRWRVARTHMSYPAGRIRRARAGRTGNSAPAFGSPPSDELRTPRTDGSDREADDRVRRPQRGRPLPGKPLKAHTGNLAGSCPAT